MRTLRRRNPRMAVDLFGLFPRNTNSEFRAPIREFKFRDQLLIREKREQRARFVGPATRLVSVAGSYADFGSFCWCRSGVQLEETARMSRATTLVQSSDLMRAVQKLKTAPMLCETSFSSKGLRVPFGLLTVSALSITPSGANTTIRTIGLAVGTWPALGRKRPSAR
jgi:hypothetical protein